MADYGPPPRAFPSPFRLFRIHAVPARPQRLLTLFALLLLAGTGQAQPVGLPVPPVEIGTAPAITGARVPCTGSRASGYACRDVDLMAFVPIADLGGATNVGAAGAVSLNDIWGWTDPETGREYAIVGRTDGTAFVDVTQPESPVFLGLLPRTPGTAPSSWRDIKVHANHAYIVSEATGQGMQVFDLTQLRGLSASPGRLFTQTALYSGVSRTHNLVINEETARAYAVGTTGVQISASCGQGLHIISLENPAAPAFVGCFRSSVQRGYTHDAQCVVYRGPDSRYAGREICLGSDEGGIAISDVTDAPNVVEISTQSYPSVAYTHQGWLSEDHRYFFVDDELDERNGLVFKTRTLVFDLLELDSPVLINEHLGTVNSIDHNQYVVGHYTFQANYTSGLRILDVSDPRNLVEVAYFDTYPLADNPSSFLGLWSVYPFFESGNVVVSDISGGLFVLRPTRLALSSEPQLPPAAFALRGPRVVTGEETFTLDLPEAKHVRVALYDAAGRQVALLADAAFASGTHTLTLRPDGLASGTYFVRATGSGRAETRIVAVVR